MKHLYLMSYLNSVILLVCSKFHPCLIIIHCKLNKCMLFSHSIKIGTWEYLLKYALKLRKIPENNVSSSSFNFLFFAIMAMLILN